MKTSNIFLGILGAAAAGVVIGLLVAPKKGSALRSDMRSGADDISRKLNKLLHKGKSKYAELRDMVDEEGANLERSVRDIAGDATGTYKEYSGKAEGAYNELSKGAKRAWKKANS